MRRFILSIIIFAVSLSVMAQIGSGSSAAISGKVADGATDDPMTAATVSVIEAGSGRVVTGAITGADGVFEVTGVPFGVYTIAVSFVGYSEKRLENISVDSNEPELSLGTIVLDPSNISLDEVMIVSDKPVIENRFDKIVYNVSSDITSRGTQAIDVLRKVPHVTVDADGNVELQGNSNIRFLINGKTSSVFGNNLADALASIPASQIKTIEALTNPGAKYDLQGTGGVINIILEENRLQGVSGNVNLTAGTRNQNGSLNLGVKKGNFGLNGYFSGNFRLGTDGSNSSVRETVDPLTGASTLLVQNGTNRFERNGYRAGTGFEWDITRGMSLSGSVGYNSFNFGSSGIVNIDQSTSDASGIALSTRSSVRNFTSERETSSIDWNVDFKKKFGKEGHDLDIIYSSTHGNPHSQYFLTLTDIGFPDPRQGSVSDNPGTDRTSTIQVDYVNPLNETTTLEAGLKGIFNDLTSTTSVEVFDPDLGDYVFDPLQSYELGYSLNVYAAYISAGFRVLNWLDIKPGARYEYSDISIDYPGASVPSYGTLVPSVLLSHNFNDKQSLQLTYTRRIRRPGYNDLNPFINRSDPYNFETGNVLLRPEVGERIELGFNTGFAKGGNLRITLAQRIDSREIEDISTFYPTFTVGDSVYSNILLTTKDNVGSEYNSGVNLFGSIPITSKLNVRSNLGLFYGYLESTTSIGSMATGFRFRGNLNATWQLPRKFMLEAFGFWRSGGKGIQGRDPQFYIYNFGIRKLFWNDNGSLGLTATNVFRREIRQVSTIATENSTLRNVRELPFRSFGISFSYKFGKMQERQNRNDNDFDSFGGGGDQ